MPGSAWFRRSDGRLEVSIASWRVASSSSVTRGLCSHHAEHPVGRIERNFAPGVSAGRKQEQV
jgi:hypothetical protein